MRRDKDARLGETVPRYTSYPTAPHFHAGVKAETVDSWLAAVPAGDGISLYVHVPFCDRLCWFCACHTRHTLRYEPIEEFLRLVHAEIGLVARRLPRDAVVRALHFGGGSPTMLRPDDLIALMAAIRSAFAFAPDAAISIEIDPNDMDEARLDAVAAVGVTRASLGVQDFDPKVQAAINREQSFEVTRDVVDGLVGRGVGSVNLDLLYGLPHQTVDGIAATVRQALSLAPDRMALFGYAHVPWFKKHQQMIDETVLPDGRERLAQMSAAAELIRDAGYAAIGIDHFARPDDALTEALREGQLRRNFQGYTNDSLETLIGLGPSSISRYRQGHAQNTPAMPLYRQAIEAGRLPVVRGIAFSDDDRVRGWIIERLMCDFAFSASQVRRMFSAAAEPALQIAEAMAAEPHALLRRVADHYVVPGDDGIFVRLAAARFDAYLGAGGARHSRAV